MNAMDLYGSFENIQNSNELEQLVKAMSTGGESTGVDFTGQETSGSSLKMESLDPQVKVLTNTDKYLKLIKRMPKEKVGNTVHQFNQLVDYGTQGTGIFNLEGATPGFTDSKYTRKSAYIKFTGISGEVTDPMRFMKLNAVQDMLATEAKNKTQFLLRALDSKIPTANSKIVDAEFDGLFKQHYAAISSDESYNGIGLSTYYSSKQIVDARGKCLRDNQVQEATEAVINIGYGEVNHLVANTTTFMNYSKRIEGIGMKRINVGSPISATTGATMGFKVNDIQTQAGAVSLVDDVFFDKQAVSNTSASASSTSAPTAPVADVSTPAAAIASLGSNMTAGDYYYAVSAVNKYGESALTALTASGSPVTVAAAGGVDLKFTAGAGGEAATGYKIYRSVVDGDFSTLYNIFDVSADALTLGYDSAGAGEVRDRDYIMANTSTAMVTDMSTNVLSMLELAPMRRLDLAFINPSYRFMILYYTCVAIFAPKKLVRIVNIGTDLTD